MDVQRAAELSRRLREHGLRATGPRVDMLAALEDLGGHRTADEVRDRLGAGGRALPRSSVYNVLTSLAEAGLALTADAGPGPVLYEAGREWHHHFVCRSCHRVFDVDCLAGTQPCLTPGTDVGVVDEAQVIFRGICTACGSRAIAIELLGECNAEAIAQPGREPRDDSRPRPGRTVRVARLGAIG